MRNDVYYYLFKTFKICSHVFAVDKQFVIIANLCYAQFFSDLDCKPFVYLKSITLNQHTEFSITLDHPSKRRLRKTGDLNNVHFLPTKLLGT